MIVEFDSADRGSHVELGQLVADGVARRRTLILDRVLDGIQDRIVGGVVGKCAVR